MKFTDMPYERVEYYGTAEPHRNIHESNLTMEQAFGVQQKLSVKK